MLVVKIELHSANTGQTSEIGRMRIYNDGTGTKERGNYVVEVFRKSTKNVLRKSTVKDYPRLDYNVWRLVSRALRAAFPEEI